MTDGVFEKYGIEEEEFNASVLFYNLMNDPEVMRIIMGNMQKLGLGGGGPGGFMGGMWSKFFNISHISFFISKYFA